LATFGEPDSPGVPAGTVADTRLARFNHLESVEAALATGDVACVILEPVPGNMGVVPPAEGFLAGVRELCDRHGALLIFDEVMTGFRVAPGGAQQLYDVRPDLTCLGKVVAGGTPAAAYGGRADLMRMVAPEGPVYQAGTLAGNPLAVAAGLATLRCLQEDSGVYARLEETGRRLQQALQDALTAHGVPGCVQRVGSMLTLFFGPRQVSSWDDAARCDRSAFARFHQAALQAGVLVPPSQFEAWFLTDAHRAVVDELVESLSAAVEEVAR
jgi:glutamate-1-semialdehyde 2,1-aminomutase